MPQSNWYVVLAGGGAKGICVGKFVDEAYTPKARFTRFHHIASNWRTQSRHARNGAGDSTLRPIATLKQLHRGEGIDINASVLTQK
jgi:hypothetical protein